MTTLTRKGATVEEAVAAALQSLDASHDEVEIEVIERGRKGFLGFGVKQAEVTVTVKEVVKTPIVEVGKVERITEDEVEHSENDSEQTIKSSEEDPIQETQRYLQDIAIGMGIDDLEITNEVSGKYVNFQLESKRAAVLIGKRGQTLNAMQQLSQLVANKTAGQFKVVRIDIGDYRDRRKQSLEILATRMADKAVRTRNKVKLEPMQAYERKVIHHTLSNRLDIETYSEGSDPYRYLVIEPI